MYVVEVPGGSNQPILDNQGQIWSFDADLDRQMTPQSVIQVGLPFGHFVTLTLRR